MASAFIMRSLAAYHWGQIQDTTPVCEGVTWYSTPGHGGVVADVEAAGLDPEIIARATHFGLLENGCLVGEEDCEWALVFALLPKALEAYNQLRQRWGVEQPLTQDDLFETLDSYKVLRWKYDLMIGRRWVLDLLTGWEKRGWELEAQVSVIKQLKAEIAQLKAAQNAPVE